MSDTVSYDIVNFDATCVDATIYDATASMWEYIISMVRSFEQHLCYEYETWKKQTTLHSVMGDKPVIAMPGRVQNEATSDNHDEGSGKESVLKTLIDTLPREPSITIYETILASADRKALISALENEIARRRRLHRSRTAQIVFLEWVQKAHS